MGCFLGCLRTKDDDDDDRLLPTSRHGSREVVVSRNPLSFLSRAFKRKEETSLLDRPNLDLGSQRDDSGFKEELTFPKASDSLAGNMLVLPRSNDSESSRFHYCLPNTSFEKLQLQVQSSSIPATPTKFSEEWKDGKDSIERAPCSSACIAHDTQFGSRCSKDERTKQSLHAVHGTRENETEANAASASPSPSTTDIQRKSKSLRFEFETDLSSYGYKQSSPYPTPLKISDEMRTPGTVYPATFMNQPNHNKPRVRSQIVYSYNHLAKNISQCEILEEEDEEGFHLEQDSGELSSSFEHVENSTPTPKKELKEVSYESECGVEASLSWLKNASVINEERNCVKETSHDQIPNLYESPSDRPVLGMVDAHWNEDENPQIPSPRLWYGNGIPNTTNKYKEDQKVNWHATPFEERLEKALSDKSFISQRNSLCGKPYTFENKDNDTALSQLEP